MQHEMLTGKSELAGLISSLKIFIMVELKALAVLENAHLAQAKNYLEAYKMQIGLLINFWANKLEFKRVHIDKPIARN